MSEGRIAVIGASGFVGSALCERLFFEGRQQVAAFIHSSASAARIARLSLPFHELDLLDSGRVMAALTDCSTIVNCSRGDEHLMVKGLANLLRAAKVHKVRKFIHLSSVAIYGDDPVLESSHESCPPSPGGNVYGLTKLKQDQMVAGLADGGIEAFSLCPSNISGPYSPFIEGLLSRMSAGPLPLVDDGNHPCNLVHVDNLVEAILTLHRTAAVPPGRYFVNELQPVSWRQYFQDLTRLVGVTCDFVAVTRKEVIDSTSPISSDAGLTDHVKIAFSGEFRRGLMLMPAFRRINAAAYGAFLRLPEALQGKIRDRVQRPMSIQRETQTPTVDDPYVRVQARRVFHAPSELIDKARFAPVLDYERGIETTAAWWRAVKGNKADVPGSSIERSVSQNVPSPVGL